MYLSSVVNVVSVPRVLLYPSYTSYKPAHKLVLELCIFVTVVKDLFTILLKTLQLFCKNLSLALEVMLVAKSNTGSKNINEPLVQP